MTKEQPLMVEVERLRIHLARAKATNAATALSLAAADTAWQELHDEMADAEAEIARLRAELAEVRRKYLDAHAEGYWSARSDRESGAFRPSFEQFEAMEAAIARVRELWTTRGLAVPPAILRALAGAE